MAWLGQAIEHEADHSEADEGCDRGGIAFEISHKTAIPVDPCEGAFHDPSLWQDDEPMEVGSLDDFEFPGAGGSHNLCPLFVPDSGVRENTFDESITSPYLA